MSNHSDTADSLTSSLLPEPASHTSQMPSNNSIDSDTDSRSASSITELRERDRELHDPLGLPLPNGTQKKKRTTSVQSAASITSPAIIGMVENANTQAEIENLLLDPGTQRFPAVVGDAYNNLPTYPLRPSYREYHSSLRPQSRCVVFDGCPDNPHKPASVPIYQTATFEQPSSTEFGSYDYSRSGNPTRTALEKQAAMLEFAHAAFAFTSGMAALNCITRLLRPGDTFLLTSDIYGGMHRLVQRVTSLYNINIVFVNTWNLDEIVRAFETHPRCKLLHMETPSNPLMRVTDIRGVSDICRRYNCLLSVDSTMMSPYLQQPINHGADIVMHSMTKFFGGHSDTMGGIVAVADESLAKEIAFYQNAEGSGLAPFDCWLFLRGLKTLAIRVDKAQENAVQIATFLKRQDKIVKEVFYAGLEPTEQEMKTNQQKYKDFKVHMGQSKGGGSLISFTTGECEMSKRIIDSLRLFKITVSFGSCNSLVEMPAYQSHASIPDHERTLPDDLIRLSAGIEDVNDLLDDLQQAFIAVGAGEVVTEGGVSIRKSLKSSASMHISTKTIPVAPKVTSISPSYNPNNKKKFVKSVVVTDDQISFSLDKSNMKALLAFMLGIIISVVILKVFKFDL